MKFSRTSVGSVEQSELSNEFDKKFYSKCPAILDTLPGRTSEPKDGDSPDDKNNR